MVLTQFIRRNNNEKTALFIVLIVLSGLCAFAQTNVIEAHFKIGDVDFSNAFKNKHNEARANDQIHSCIISVTFAKFTIDTLGNGGKISFHRIKMLLRLSGSFIRRI